MNKMGFGKIAKLLRRITLCTQALYGYLDMEVFALKVSFHLSEQRKFMLMDGLEGRPKTKNLF